MIAEISSAIAPYEIHGHSSQHQCSRPPPAAVDFLNPTTPPPSRLGCVLARIAGPIKPREPFEVELWLEPFEFARTSLDSARISLAQSAAVTYEPRTVVARLGERPTVTVKVNETRSGLYEIAGSADSWDPLGTTVSSGFKGKLETRLEGSLSAGRNHTLTLHFVDQSSPDQQLQLDAPVDVELTATEAQFQSEAGKWTPALTVRVDPGASSTKMISLRPNSSVGSTGRIMAQAKIHGGFVISQSHFDFTIKPAWWIALLLSLLGAVLYSFLRISREHKNFTRRRSKRSFMRTIVIPTLISGVIAGILAFLLGSGNVLGIQVDTRSLHGYVILGLLFSYVGVDAILEKLSPRPRRAPANGAVSPSMPHSKR